MIKIQVDEIPQVAIADHLIELAHADPNLTVNPGMAAAVVDALIAETVRNGRRRTRRTPTR